MHQDTAFVFLFPGREQADSGVRDVKDITGVIAAHQGKLQEELRPDIGVGAHIQNETVALFRVGRENRPQGRALDPLDPAQAKERRRQCPARVARRDKGVTFAIFDQA